MSIKVVRWVLMDAEDVPTDCVAVLIGLAWHADHDGRNAFPTRSMLARYARKSPRQVIRDLQYLESRGLIRRGNQDAAADRPANRRPVVYDIPGVTPTSPQKASRGAAHDMSPVSGVTSMTCHTGSVRGDTHDTQKVLKRSKDSLSRRSNVADRVGNASEEEMRLLIEKIKTDRPDVGSPVAYLRRVYANGDMAGLLEEVRSENGRRRIAAELANARADPALRCEHGMDGGIHRRSDTGRLVCPQCRSQNGAQPQ